MNFTRLNGSCAAATTPTLPQQCVTAFLFFTRSNMLTVLSMRSPSLCTVLPRRPWRWFLLGWSLRSRTVVSGVFDESRKSVVCVLGAVGRCACEWSRVQGAVAGGMKSARGKSPPPPHRDTGGTLLPFPPSFHCHNSCPCLRAPRRGAIERRPRNTPDFESPFLETYNK